MNKNKRAWHSPSVEHLAGLRRIAISQNEGTQDNLGKW